MFSLVSVDSVPGEWSSSCSRARIASPSGSRNKQDSSPPSASHCRRYWSGTCWQIRLRESPAARTRRAPSNKLIGSTWAVNSLLLANTATTPAMPTPGAAGNAAVAP